MPTPSVFKSKFGKEAEEMSLYMVCSCTQALFRNRRTLNDTVWEDTAKSCKILLRRTNNDEKVRTLLGTNMDTWKEIHHVFALAIPVLEAHSLAPVDPQTGVSGSFSALIASNHDTLIKDLDRLNDILMVARNCLATVTKAQDLAGESLLDQQVQKLIDLCVRVTARGYDGDAGNRAEIQWGNVIGACKSRQTLPGLKYLSLKLTSYRCLKTKRFSSHASNSSIISYRRTSSVSFYYG